MCESKIHDFFYTPMKNKRGVYGMNTSRQTNLKANQSDGCYYIQWNDVEER